MVHIFSIQITREYAYFDYKLGTLEYRSVCFETETLDKPNFQGNAAVNYTDRETPWTRIIEHKLDVDSLVSMNMWGLTPDFLKTLEEGFKEFFEKEVPANPLKAEYLIPTFIGELLAEGKMSVKVLRTNDTWYGMTYKEDVAAVKESFSKMLENGTYKGDLFSDL